MDEEFQFNDPASPEAWSRLPIGITRLLPDDYREFMLRHNGGWANVGEYFIALSPLEELEDWNTKAEVSSWFPEGGVLIGSNGCGEWFGFFQHQGRRVFGQVPAIGMEPDTIWEIAMSFAEFMAQPPLDEGP